MQLTQPWHYVICIVNTLRPNKKWPPKQTATIQPNVTIQSEILDTITVNQAKDGVSV